MSLQRACYLCGKPVSIRRQMSLFCSDRCELRHRALSRALGPAPTAPATATTTASGGARPPAPPE